VESLKESFLKLKIHERNSREIAAIEIEEREQRVEPVPRRRRPPVDLRQVLRISLDDFLAARAVGKTGRVIGVDMTHEMLSKARENAQKNRFANVQFRLGEIEALPVADNSVDVIISNCVINLSPEKQRVFNEAFRVLKPGGRLTVADMVATASLPDDIKADWVAYTGCMSGASQITELEHMLEASGFKDIKIEPKDSSRSFIREWLPGKKVEDYLVSATIEAVKP